MKGAGMQKKSQKTGERGRQDRGQEEGKQRRRKEIKKGMGD